MKHLKYLRYVLRHKFFVFEECLKYGLVWQGIIHDWSKFLPSEWCPYVEFFYGETNEATKKVLQVEFDAAWNHHQKQNPHHWQYWLLFEDNPSPDAIERFRVLPMPDRYRKEMLADWRGASRAQNNGHDNSQEWYRKNRNNIILHPSTRFWVERELGISGVFGTKSSPRTGGPAGKLGPTCKINARKVE